MAAKRKLPKAKKKGTPKKLPVGVLGPGLLGRAGKGMIMEEKRRQCMMDGGTWKNGKCIR